MGKPFASIEKALDILFLFNSQNRELSAAEISNTLGMPISSTYRYLEIFIKRGILRKQQNTKKVSLGLSIFRLGLLASEKVSLRDITHPFMVELAEKSQETVILTMIHGLEAMCVETVESRQMLRLSMRPGATVPLHAGSTSKILLAFQEDSFIDKVINSTELKKINTNTITDGTTLKEELKQIKSQGYAESESEVDTDAASIAAPIYDYTNKVIAGLTVAGPSNRIKSFKQGDLVDMVCGFAQRVSIAFGCDFYYDEK